VRLSAVPLQASADPGGAEAEADGSPDGLAVGAGVRPGPVGVGAALGEDEPVDAVGLAEVDGAPVGPLVGVVPPHAAAMLASSAAVMTKVEARGRVTAQGYSSRAASA
jgi:hypothetical protein